MQLATDEVWRETNIYIFVVSIFLDVADYVWWDVADYVWWDVADYVSILKSNSATTNEAAPYSRLGIDGSFRTIKMS